MQEHPAVTQARQQKLQVMQKLEFIIKLFNSFEFDKLYEVSDSSALVLAVNPAVITQYKNILEKSMKISEMIEFVDAISDQILFVFEQNSNKPIKKNGVLHLHLLELNGIVQNLKKTIEKINL